MKKTIQSLILILFTGLIFLPLNFHFVQGQTAPGLIGDYFFFVSDTYATKNHQSVRKDKVNINYTNASYELGTIKTINLYDTRNGGIYQEFFQVKAVSEHAVVWASLDDIVDFDADQVGEEFDVSLYPLLSQYYGEHLDIDSDGKLSILFHDIKDSYDGKDTSPYIAGYFYPPDLSLNQMDIIHLDTNPGLKVGIANIIPTLLHETVHLINYTKFFLSGSPKNYDLWIDEGIAESAAQIYGKLVLDKAYVKRVNHYNKDPDHKIRDGKVSLTIFENNLENYDLSYLFFQYLRILTSDYSWGGDNFFSSLYLSGYFGEDIFTKWLFLKLGGEYLDYRFADLLRDFKMALTLNQAEGKYGFRQERGFELTPYFSKTEDYNLRPGASIAKKTEGVVIYNPQVGENIIVTPYISRSDSYMYIDLASSYVEQKQKIKLQLVKVIIDKPLDKVTWSTTNFFKASVDKNGLVKTKRAGNVTIKARCNGEEAKVNLIIAGGSGGCTSSGYGSLDTLIILSTAMALVYIWKRGK